VSQGSPDTPHGHDAHEAVSALQKATRRGDTEGAAYFAWQLEVAGLGAWCWRRLKIITSEDVGHAWPEGPAVIRALHDTYIELGKAKRRGDGLLVLVHAVILLAEASKSRLACWMVVAFDGGAVPRRQIPGEALDRHTRRGRRMGRGWDQFWSEASYLERHEPHELEEKYRALARQAVDADKPPPPADDDPPTLFSTSP